MINMAPADKAEHWVSTADHAISAALRELTERDMDTRMESAKAIEALTIAQQGVIRALREVMRLTR